MDKELEMPQDMRQAFELLKDCAEKYQCFIIVKNFPHMFAMNTSPGDSGHKFEVSLDEYHITVNHNGCTFFLQPYEYDLNITYYDSHIVFDFFKGEDTSIVITFFRDMVKALAAGFKGIEGSIDDETH